MTTATKRRAVPRTSFCSVRGKLTGFVTLLVALATVSLTFAGYSFVRDMLRDELREELSLHGAGLREVMLSYVSQQQERVSLVASRTRLRQLLRAYLDGEVEPEPFVAQTRRILLDARKATRDFLAIRIADLDGRVITATDDASLGTDLSRDPAYREGRTQATLGLPRPSGAGHQAMLSAPARTNEGRELGVVMVELDVRPMLGLIEAIRSGHETARVRLATRLGEQIRYIFPIPGDPPVIEVEAAADAPMAHALAGETGFLDAHPFRGRDVVAAYRPAGYRDWALVAQVDAAEAYAPVERLRQLALLASLLVLVIAAYGAFRIATGFTRPILSLSRAAKAIEKGDLDVSAPVTARDEVGDLSLAFNRMAAALKRHRDHLEDLVHERTNDLETRGEELEQSRDQLESSRAPPRAPGRRRPARFAPGRNHSAFAPAPFAASASRLHRPDPVPAGAKRGRRPLRRGRGRRTSRRARHRRRIRTRGQCRNALRSLQTPAQGGRRSDRPALPARGSPPDAQRVPAQGYHRAGPLRHRRLLPPSIPRAASWS